MEQRSFWERLFPPRYDFYAMISEQAKTTADGVTAFKNWLQNPDPQSANKLRSLTQVADTVRLEMESCLIEAFVTPFDRQDIYSLSVEMDRIIETTITIMELMIAYEVVADETIHSMVLNLEKGTSTFSNAVGMLASAPLEAAKGIGEIRRCQSDVEEGYRRGSAILFKTSDPIRIMKLREIYRRTLDAAQFLGYTVDILHRIVVRNA